MAKKDYKINEVIQVIYQTNNAKSGQIVTMEIFDETGNKDIINFPDVAMTEIGSSGRYNGSFTPDAVGEWVIMISYSSGHGKIVKQYSIGNYNLEDIGSSISTIESPPIIGLYVYRLGNNRLFYCSNADCVVDAKAEIITPSLKVKGLFEMTYISDRLYYLDVVFTEPGSHVFNIYENGIKNHRDILFVSNNSLILYPKE